MTEEKIHPAPSAFKADVWSYFGFKTKEGSKDFDKSHSIFKLCSAGVKYCGNTTNLRAHMARHQSNVASNATLKTKLGDPTQRTIEEVNTSKLPATSTRAVKITKSVLVFICKDMRPLSVVEDKGFRDMIKTLELRYAVPSRQHIADIALPNLYNEVKATVLDSLGSAETVALTCDAWTSRATESYVTVKAHHINDEWILQSHVLQTRAMHETHTGEHIAALLKEAVTEWGLNTKKVITVTDNGPNMAVAAKLAEEVVRALKPMKDTTMVMSEESVPTLSVIAPLHAKLMIGAQESHDDTLTVSDIKAAIAEDLGKRHASEKDTLHMASAVDPRFKGLPFLSEAATRDIYSRLLEAVVEEENVAEDAHINKSCASISQPPLKRPRTSCALVDLLGATFPSTSSDNTEPKSENDLAACETKKYRVSLQRVFSSAGDIVTAQRSLLKADYVDQLVFLHKNLEI
ncbi:E3 SUMO-protein ligase ZBED1-like [Nothobranchius furzeri]|uniref:E3 SUMO-protein ligase ZBED1-like n=1 Tax=Nothobranchius furzeri TaxID=105023 RepID=UPI003904996E